MQSVSGPTGRQRRRTVAWIRTLWASAEPHLEGTAYINHLTQDDRPEKLRASFGENYSRLRQVKAVYDPTNLFRLNANIAPYPATSIRTVLRTEIRVRCGPIRRT